MKDLFLEIKEKGAIVSIIMNNGTQYGPFIYTTAKNPIIGVEDEYVVLGGPKSSVIFVPYNSITVITQ